MTCTSCGTDNDEGRRFCIECGAALSRPCPSCGAANPPQAKFCGDCGTVVADLTNASAPPAAAGQPAGTERRLVSVLFVDLVSFTTLSEGRDAEDMRSLMDRYFEAARTVIGRHGGVVEKFIGDAVMAVWGAPVTHEDDAERAVRAGLELIDAVTALGAAEGLPLQARGGVLTGEAATSTEAMHQGMVTGDMVNTASRLQSAAGPGELFAGDATHRAASRAIAFEDVGELDLKGKEVGVRAWRALRVVAERQGANRVALEPPFVGRTEELRLLKDLLHTTEREGKARVVSISGIGGIGKSRLAWELLKYIDGLSETVWWHHGRCPAYGEGVTFWALGEMVRMRARIAESDPATTSRAKLAEAIAEHVTDEEERRWLEPRLAVLLGLGERPVGGPEELFAAWRTFFERISDRGVVAMVFEDLQWADDGLLDFIESLLEWSRAKPIYVITLARPELADRRPMWGAGQRNFVAIHLEALTDDAMVSLVRGLLPDAKDDALAKIVERAEGVPMYAVETIRMLADRGVLRAAEDRYELAGDLGDELQVPETLQALVASRLDALAPEDRALLQTAAVLGKTFTLESLAAVAGSEVSELESRMRDLVRRELITHEADPRSPERGQYGFIQSIIREVAYGMLSRADRRARHLTAAHHFEAAGEDELAGVVAAHYVEALAATPAGPAADALAARARDALGQAAERAAALGSPKQALAYLGQALAITPSGVERGELLQQAARAAEDALKTEEQLGYLRDAIEVWRAVGDVNAEVATMGRLAWAMVDDHGDQIRSLVDEMRARLGGGEDALARAELDLATGIVQHLDGENAESLASVDRALAGLEEARAWDRFRDIAHVRANLLGQVGRHRESKLLLRGILALAEEEGDLRATAEALLTLGTDQEELTEALALSLEAAEVARRGGYGKTEMIALANACEAAVEAGAWTTADEVLADLRSRAELPPEVADTNAFVESLTAAYRGDASAARAALESVRQGASAFPTLRAFLRRVRSVLWLMEGRVDEAYAEAMGAVAEEPDGINVPLAVWVAGRAAVWMKDAEKIREATSYVADLDGSWHEAIRRSFDAAVAAIEGHVDQSRAGYDAVLADRLARGDPFGHALIVVDALAVMPPHELPEDAVRRAHDHLSKLGAAPLLARLDAAARATVTET